MANLKVGLHDALRSIKQAKDTAPIQIQQIPLADNIFFTKDQLKVGSILKYYGRHAPNTTWEVTSIRFYIMHKGQLRSHKVKSPQTLADQVEIKCRNDGTCMECSFQYLSYSAIWRLEQ